MYYSRLLEKDVIHSLEINPVTAIIGPRQCGKSTMTKAIIKQLDRKSIFLDLERPSDLSKLDDPEWFLSTHKGTLICIDEIQRKPDLFPLIRSLVDEWQGNGHFLILGSASRDLIKQGSESLAGRISYKYLYPFLLDETKTDYSMEDHLVKGSFPRSLLKTNDEDSFSRREDFITTFLERDLLQWAGFSTATMRKLWNMLAHLNGQLVNYNLIANSLGVSAPTAKNYTELLSATFMIKLVQPYLKNTGKRLIKSPKVYLNDIGIANTLLGIEDFDQLMGHPSMGVAWETLVLSNLSNTFPKAQFYFYRTSHGAEIDFIMEYKNRVFAIECKASTSPVLSKGTYTAIDDLKPVSTFIVAPISESWSHKENISISSIQEVIEQIKNLV